MRARKLLGQAMHKAQTKKTLACFHGLGQGTMKLICGM